MSSPQDEIDALSAKFAALTARVYQLEQKAGLEPEASQPRVSHARVRASGRASHGRRKDTISLGRCTACGCSS
jgi:hypothetical protein